MHFLCILWHTSYVRFSMICSYKKLHKKLHKKLRLYRSKPAMENTTQNSKDVVSREDLETLTQMHRQKFKNVLARKAPARRKESWLKTLAHLTPVSFVMIFLWSCCLVEDPDFNIAWAYRESLRFNMQGQSEKNTVLRHTLGPTPAR